MIEWIYEDLDCRIPRINFTAFIHIQVHQSENHQQQEDRSLRTDLTLLGISTPFCK